MLKNRSIRLPTYLAETPAWKDYADVVSEVYDTYIDTPLAQHKDALNVNAYHPTNVALKQGKEFLSFSDYTYNSVRWVSTKNRIRASAMIGYTFAEASLLGEDTIELLVNSGAQFLPFQGKPEFVDFLNYVLNATLDVQPLWCNELRAGAQLSTYTESFTNAAHTKNATTVTSGVAYGPLGVLKYGMTVDYIKETATTAAHSTSRTFTGLTVNKAYVASRFFKKADRDWVYLTLNNGTTSATVWVNLISGAVGTNSGISNVKVFGQGNGWYRISGSYNTAAAGTTMIATWGSALSDNTSSYLGVITSGTYEFGDQFELGISATEYSYMAAPGSNVVTTTTYGTFVAEASAAVGIPVYQSGSWFPTEHVDVSITVDPSRSVNLTSFSNFFAFVAPINLVLRNVVYSSNFVFDPIYVSAALQMEVFDIISND
jgi:hypothetical protein